MTATNFHESYHSRRRSFLLPSHELCKQILHETDVVTRNGDASEKKLFLTFETLKAFFSSSASHELVMFDIDTNYVALRAHLMLLEVFLISSRVHSMMHATRDFNDLTRIERQILLHFCHLRIFASDFSRFINLLLKWLTVSMQISSRRLPASSLGMFMTATTSFVGHRGTDTLRILIGFAIVSFTSKFKFKFALSSFSLSLSNDRQHISI